MTSTEAYRALLAAEARIAYARGVLSWAALAAALRALGEPPPPRPLAAALAALWAPVADAFGPLVEHMGRSLSPGVYWTTWGLIRAGRGVRMWWTLWRRARTPIR